MKEKIGRRYLLILFVGVCVFMTGCQLGRESLANSSQKGESNASTDSGKQVSFAGINSKEVFLQCLSTGKVVARKRAKQRMYPASLTKIMTALVALEHVDSLDRVIDVPEEFFSQLYREHASRAGFEPGETATVRDLLYGVILPSGAECCLSLAKYITGTEEGFVSLMNQRAEELGMTQTHFTNTTGLQDEEHYTTVEDLSKLLVAALNNGHFRRIFTSQRHSTAASSKHPEGFSFASTLFEKLDTQTLTHGSIIGGKTGYTEQAGLCLASLAKIDGKEYICITGGADGNHKTKQTNIEDAMKLYNQMAEL